MFLERRQTLKVLVARPDHAGHYRCEAKSPAGIDKLGFTVQVWEPPKVTHSEREVSGVIGSSLALDCAATGNPIPEVTWKKDGFPITSTSVIQSNQALLIPALRLNDHHGEYVCSAANVAGKKEITFNVDVWKTPDFVDEEQIANQTVGNELELYCDVDGHPPPTITWAKNGYPLSYDRGLVLSEGNKRLTISSVSLGDIGLYQCVAVNQAGESTKNFQVSLLHYFIYSLCSAVKIGILFLFQQLIYFLDKFEINLIQKIYNLIYKINNLI